MCATNANKDIAAIIHMGISHAFNASNMKKALRGEWKWNNLLTMGSFWNIYVMNKIKAKQNLGLLFHGDGNIIVHPLGKDGNTLDLKMY